MSTGSRIKEIRIKRGLTQQELGRRIGRSKSAVNNYENNSRGINSRNLVEVFKGLGTEPNYFFQDYYEPGELTLSEDARKLYADYMNTDEYTRKTVDTIISDSLKRNTQSDPILITRPLYVNVSDFIEENGYASIPFQLRDSVENRSSTHLLICFEDAMEPAYFLKDCLLIKTCDKIGYADVGIFMKENTCFIRRMGFNELKADNPRYPEIPLDGDIRCIAKVLRKIN